MSKRRNAGWKKQRAFRAVPLLRRASIVCQTWASRARPKDVASESALFLSKDFPGDTPLRLQRLRAFDRLIGTILDCSDAVSRVAHLVQ